MLAVQKEADVAAHCATSASTVTWTRAYLTPGGLFLFYRLCNCLCVVPCFCCHFLFIFLLFTGSASSSSSCLRFYKLYSRYGNFHRPASSLEITTLSYFCSVSRNSKFCRRYCKILPLLPMRHTSSFLKPWQAWSLSPYITANIYLRTSLIDRSPRSCLQSSSVCLIQRRLKVIFIHSYLLCVQFVLLWGLV